MKYFIFTLLLAVAFARHITNFHQCSSPHGEVLSVDISPCPAFKDGGCKLQHNTRVNITVDFKTRVNTTKVQTVVHGIVPSGFLHVLLQLISHDGQEGVRFEGVDKDACAHNNVDHCNITKGETLHYTNSLFVDPIYPLLTLTVKWEIQDDQNQNLVCLIIPAEIIN